MIRRLLRRLHHFWFDGEGDGTGDEEITRAIRVARQLVRRVGIAEDPRVRHEFDELEQLMRTTERKRRES